MNLKKTVLTIETFLSRAWKFALDILSRLIEQWEKSRAARAVTVVTVSVIAFASFFFLLQSYALIGDDFAYQNIMGTEQRVQTLWDIVYSQYLHYFAWGGRSVAHFIVQFLLLIGKPWSSLITAGILLAFCAVCAKLAAGGKKPSITCYVAFLALVCLANPNFSDTVLWITGAGNYLYTLFFVLVFLLPYSSLLREQTNRARSPFMALGMFLLGIFAGWSNENTGIALIVVLTGLLILRWANKGLRAPFWCVSGLAGATIGFLTMLLAPGNGERNRLILDMYGSLFKILLHRGYMMERALFDYLWVTVVVTAILVLYTIYGRKERLSESEICYLLLAAASYVVMVASPTYPDRVILCTVVFALLADISILWRQACKSNTGKRILQFATAFIFTSFVMQSVTTVLLPYFQV